MLNKSYDFIMKNKFILLINSILIALVCIFIAVYGIEDIRNYSVDRSNDGGDSYISVYGETELAQSFTCNDNNINGFEICFRSDRSYSRDLFEVALIDSDGNIIQKWDTRRADVSEGWIGYKTSNPLIKGQNYAVVIKGPALSEKNKIDIRTTEMPWINVTDDNIVFDECLYSGGETAYVALSFLEFHKNIFAVLAIIITLLLLNLWFIMYSKSIEKRCFVIIMLLGIVTMMIISPGANHDDDFHYCSTLTLSNILLGKENASDIETEYKYSFKTDENSYSNFSKVYEKIVDFSDIDKDSTGNIRAVGYGLDGQANPIGHIIPAIGLSIARLFSLNIVQAYTLARFFNLLAYAMAFQFAFTRIQIKKELLLLLAINPMWMQQATSLSYDVSIIIFSLLFVILVIQWINEKKKIQWFDIIILSLLLFLFSPIKQVYYIHGLLLLAIPKEQFKSIYDKLIKCVATFGIVIVYPRLILFINKSLITNNISSNIEIKLYMSEGIGSVNTNYSLGDILANPIEAFRMFFSAVEFKTADMIEKLFGQKLAVSADIPHILIWIYMVILIIILFSEAGEIEYRLKGSIQLKISLISILEIGVLTSAAFLMTGYGEKMLGDMQGRYYIPCVVMLLMGIQLKPLIKRNKSIDYLLIGFICAFYIRVIFAVTSQVV